jgi:hypothetical protein
LAYWFCVLVVYEYGEFVQNSFIDEPDQAKSRQRRSERARFIRACG